MVSSSLPLDVGLVSGNTILESLMETQNSSGLAVPLTVSGQSVGATCELVPLNDNCIMTSSTCSDTRPDTDNVPDDRH